MLGAVQSTYLGITQIQLTHRTGHADIAQTALLFEPSGFFQGALMRKQAFLHTGQEHQREFQALSRMQAHKLDAVFPFPCLALASL